MTQTVADASRSYRQRRARKLERYEAALREIAGDQTDASGCDPQIMRDAARLALGL